MDQGALIGIVSLILGLIGGVAILQVYRLMQYKKNINSAKKDADKIISRAKSKASKIEKSAEDRAKDFERKAKKNAEVEVKKQKQRLTQEEKNLKRKEADLVEELKGKETELEEAVAEYKEKEERLTIAQDRIKSLDKEATERIDQLKAKLERVATLSEDQAKAELKKAFEDEVRKSCEEDIQKIEAEAESRAKDKAQRILVTAISRFASEVATERTTSQIGIAGEEMKGKIIGREGRNIRALEAATGVDLIIDETPDTVVISCFDPVRREVAKEGIDRLMRDGRVHPSRIEEVIAKVKTDIYGTIKEDGEKACVDLGLSGIHPNVMQMLGSLKYRRSHMQNIYKQSIEVGYLAGLLASEINTSVNWARRAGLLHAIGCSVDHTFEGSYAKVGSEYLKKHGETDQVCQAVRCHNGEKEAVSLLDHLVQAAYNLTMARPGAKRSMMESYIKRLEDLESIGNSFDGVSRTFALQAGKEIRVLVDSGKVTEDQSQMLVRDIARKIEREIHYGRQIKVSVVRETRIVEHAR